MLVLDTCLQVKDILEEGREVLMHAVLDRAVSENPQVKSFIISHISNILSSTAPETPDLRQRIREAFQCNEIEMLMEPNELSRYYRLGSLEGNMIFESPNELPRVVMLEMTLNTFGFDMDLIEIGMEGKSYELIVKALFGNDGFFPDIIMKTTLYATDKMPAELTEVLDNMLPFMGNEETGATPLPVTGPAPSGDMSRPFRCPAPSGVPPLPVTGVPPLLTFD
ncbi:unnamed protein product [Leuciscus chuanchicus]